jgi:hypothetical protein
MVYSPWTPSTIVSIEDGGHLTVKFDSPIINDPLNPYGKDFIVFGNSFFTGSGWVQADTDMTQYTIKNGSGWFEEAIVSVSADGQEWHTFSRPFADGLWPTQAYSAWDHENGSWDHSSPADFRLPMDPSLTPEDFSGLSVVDALVLYGNSAGGTAFDIGVLGLDEISYIRVEGNGVEVNAFASVRPVPEPATIGILLIGGLGLAFRRRIRK